MQTRNHRLSAIRAFARFVASREPAYLEWSTGIRAIATKKAAPQPVSWLGKDKMEALLKVPDRQTARGRVEHALLLFLWNTGARVSEATALQVRDIDPGRGGAMRWPASLARAASSANARSGRGP